MVYQTFKPSIPLQQYIKCYFIWERSESLSTNFFEINSAPNGYSGIVINYCEPYSTWSAEGKWEKTDQSFVAGQFTKKYKLGIEGNLGVLGVVFWPGAMHRLLKIPTIEFTDRRIDMNLIFGRDFKFLEEQIVESKTNENRVAILDRFFIDFIVGSSNFTDIVDEALDNILRCKGVLPIHNLSNNYSSRHFRRLFTDRVGVSPKMYSRIKRFNYISYLSTNNFQNWQDIVYKGGFYDQAHFIRDFCHFSGKKPTEYVNYSRELIELMGA